MASVFFVLLNWNQYSLTAQCIRSLQNLQYKDYQILVIDNASSDNSADLLQRDFGHQIKLIRNQENLGFAKGNNIGIEHALAQKAQYIMVINNDTVVDSDFLEPLLQTIKSSSTIAVVTPKIYFMHQPRTIWAAGGEINWHLGIAHSRGKGQKDSGQFDRQEPVDYATGCAMLFSRASLEKVGLFDDSYFAYFEDADWCVRAKKQGFQIVYVPESKIWHVAGASTRKNKKKPGKRTSPSVYYLNARNNLWFIKRHTTGLIRFTALISYVFRYLLLYMGAFLLLRRWKKANAIWKGVQEGWTEAGNSDE
ncbi:MAG TPA: glycosyltransferase family 2 protein [Phaeodactylibacter sp.]|nr:glycosyltransferase family 2 protein [Phaeodactylibacter sp.]